MSIRVIAATLALALLPLAACSDESDGADDRLTMNASFEAYSVNDSLVPFVQGTVGDSCVVLQTGGRLTFYIDGRFTLSLTSNTHVCNGMYQSGNGYSSVGTYWIEGNDLTLREENGTLQTYTGRWAPVAPLDTTWHFEGVEVTVAGAEYYFQQVSAETP